jgi:uncharacterized protein (DUF2147 family)
MVRKMPAATAGLLAVALACGPASAQSVDDAFGLWLNPENGSNIEFYKCGGEGLCAKLIKVTDGQATDDKNPDAAKRNQPIIGLVIMENAKKSGAKWSGTLYNRENGKSYSGTITVKSKDAVDLSGCVAAILCRTVTWTRIK